MDALRVVVGVLVVVASGFGTTLAGEWVRRLSSRPEAKNVFCHLTRNIYLISKRPSKTLSLEPRNVVNETKSNI